METVVKTVFLTMQENNAPAWSKTRPRAGYSPLIGLLIDLGQMQVIYSNTHSDATH